MGQVVSVLLDQCGSLESVLIQTVLSWLTPIDRDFGPFSVELKSASVQDDEDESSHISLSEFSLEGVGLHGKVSADLPMIGYQELPINLNMGLNKPADEKLVQVAVNDFDFEANDHADDAETKERGLMGDLGSVAGGFMSGGLVGAFSQVLQMDSIKSWVCEQVSDIINEQIRKRVGGGDDDDEESEED
mmetsp:Transcript_144302/g.402131  ORF Transcript_144302/g.402131 Transcript_144302/m.402131 type:complete len:189 (+) Transcript_144302:66-632(+)